MPKRKRTSTILYVVLVFFLAAYVYWSNPDNLFLALMILILGFKRALQILKESR